MTIIRTEDCVTIDEVVLSVCEDGHLWISVALIGDDHYGKITAYCPHCRINLLRKALNEATS